MRLVKCNLKKCSKKKILAFILLFCLLVPYFWYCRPLHLNQLVNESLVTKISLRYEYIDSEMNFHGGKIHTVQKSNIHEFFEAFKSFSFRRKIDTSKIFGVPARSVEHEENASLAVYLYFQNPNQTFDYHSLFITSDGKMDIDYGPVKASWFNPKKAIDFYQELEQFYRDHETQWEFTPLESSDLIL